MLSDRLEETHSGYKAEYGNYRVKIVLDEFPENPRTWQGFGTMVYWHSRYILGDVNGKETYGSSDEFLETIGDDAVILPLYIYDHSMVVMNTTGFGGWQHAEWDSGQVGWIYVDHDRILSEFDRKRMSKKLHDRIEENLIDEVMAFSQYLSGDIWSYYVEYYNETEEVLELIDCCGGFYGRDQAVAEAEDAIKWNEKTLMKFLEE